MREEEFYTLISTYIADNPEWLKTAINAVNDGIKGAFDKLEKRASNTHTAFLCALGLLDSKRLTDDMKHYLSANIIEKINKTEHKTPIENKFLEESKEAQG